MTEDRLLRWRFYLLRKKIFNVSITDFDNKVINIFCKIARTEELTFYANKVSATHNVLNVEQAVYTSLFNFFICTKLAYCNRTYTCDFVLYFPHPSILVL